MAQITIDEAGNFNRRMNSLYKKMSEEIRKRIKNGVTPEKAIDDVMFLFSFKTKLTDEIFRVVIGSYERAIHIPGAVKNRLAFREWWLDKHWPDQALTLSQSINDLARMTEIKQTIREALKNQKTWVQLSKFIGDQKLQSGDIAKYIRDLENASRRVLAGDIEAINEYRKALNKSKREVEKLAQAGAPTTRLKKAYENVIRKSEALSADGLDKAMDRAIRTKIRYNSDRIARTEIARAYIGGTYERIEADEDAVGLHYELSSRHPEPDICDFHTEADLYGLGPGNYPLNSLPPYPFHPQCLCTASAVYRGNMTGMNNRKAVEYLLKQPERTKRALLGAKGTENFKRNPKTWTKNLKNYNGHEKIGTLQGRVSIKSSKNATE